MWWGRERAGGGRERARREIASFFSAHWLSRQFVIPETPQDVCCFTMLVTVDVCQFSVLVNSMHLSLVHILPLDNFNLPLDNFNLPLYSTQNIFWFCRDCPGFEPGTTGFCSLALYH